MWNPIQDLEVKLAVKAIIQQISKWGPTAIGVVATVATFLSPSIDAMVKAHPKDVAWVIVAALAAHYKKSPLQS